MLAIAIIVFREVLEASLIVGIVLAASVGIPFRGRWVAGGIAGGVVGASFVAAFAASIAGAFQGNGQELLNATVLCLAVCMLGWHNIWMARHARAMAADASSVGREVAAGAKPLAALALITGAAVLREGSETVLFVFGILAGTQTGFPGLLAGGLIGLAGGVAAGAAIYLGLLRIPLHRLFQVTSWMVLLLAAGLAAQAAAFLVQANLLPPLGNEVWDTSWLLSEDSIPGRVLHTLIGYVAQPEGVQLVAFGLTLLAIGIPMKLIGRPRRAAVVTVALLTVGTIGMPRPAHAELRVFMPTVDYRELEFEHNGLLEFGPKGSGFDHAQSYTNAIGYGVRPWWRVEAEGEMASGAGQSLHWTANTIENVFQLTEPGEYELNLGFFAEYSQSTLNGVANSITAGPIVQKELSDTFGVDSLHTLNLFFSRDVGHDATRATGLDISWQSVVRWKPLIAPGFEYYGIINDMAHAGSFDQQQHLIGPVLTGEHIFGSYGKIRYEVGYLFGLTPEAPHGAVRWKLEYELAF